MAEKCGIKRCDGRMGPGSAEVGFMIEDKLEKVRVCPEHAWMFMTSPRGTFHINPDRSIRAIPAKQIII